MKMTLSEELTWRGFAHQTTLPSLAELDKKTWVFYHGYDASADSLTIGNLAAIMLDKAFIRHGHKAVILAGGATSLIGDPGGKDSERPLQPEAVVAANVAKVKKQMELLFGRRVHMVNNLDWFKGLRLLDFLRSVGKHFSMTPLVQRDYIAKRMGKGGSGISYTEFSYTLLQGYDFLQLFQTRGVELQLAGSDQWGNVLSGIELIRRVTGREAHAITMPLIIDSATGKKFGKSEAGAIWLDAEKTSVYRFYQFWLNLEDDAAVDYLKIYTELDKPAIDAIAHEFNADRTARLAQKTLAYEVTKLVHGPQKAESVRRVSEVLFGSGNYQSLTNHDYDVLKAELPTVKVQDTLARTLVEAGLASSNSEAANFITAGAVYINGQRVGAGEIPRFKRGHNILKRGKNSFAVVISK